MKVLMKGVKLIEKIGRKHRTDANSLTKPTNVLTMQVTTKCMMSKKATTTPPPISNPANGAGIYKNNS